MFSARFDEQHEDDQLSEENELYINLYFNQNLKKSDIDKIDVRSQLEQQIQNQESKGSDNNIFLWNY